MTRNAMYDSNYSDSTEEDNDNASGDNNDKMVMMLI